MKGAVLDACVSLKWVFNDEVGVPQAKALRDSYLADPVGFPILIPNKA
ncbi:MAG: hypothetical protein ACOY9Y_09160 [Bacillota bacterium]